MFIELTDRYNCKSFCLNVNEIKIIRSNGRDTIVTTKDTQFVVCETYDQIVKALAKGGQKLNP